MANVDILKNPTLNANKLYLKIDLHKIVTIIMIIFQAFQVYRFYDFKPNIWDKTSKNILKYCIHQSVQACY